MARAVGSASTAVNNFLSPLDTRYIDGTGWEVLQPFTYRLTNDVGAEFVRVGVGFVTDFASIPRLLKARWPSPGGPWDKPVVIHDCLFKERKVYNGINGSYRMVDRAGADAIFYEAMRVTGTVVTSRWCIYRGVRFGGWGPWRRYRKAEENGSSCAA